MKEDFLHYLWQYQLFSPSKLVTTKGIDVSVIKTGEHNNNAGPDFFNAQVRIDGQLWAGNIEIHVRSSDWYVHGHENDKAYDTIILHVVWEYDVELYRKDNSVIPTIELKDKIDKQLVHKYYSLFQQNGKWINCEQSISTIDGFVLNSWLEKLYIERLEQKTTLIDELLHHTKNDWEAVLFILLAKNVGLNINGTTFLQFAKHIDFSIVRKTRHQLLSLEALFFGQAGFLADVIEDGYYQQLQKEYNYLKTKFNLEELKLDFQFFRLRPPNFPTVRLAQLAALYHQKGSLFTDAMEVTEISKFYDLFKVAISDYWKTHYSFTATSKKSPKNISKELIDLIIINTIIPLKFKYQQTLGVVETDKILELATQLKAEKNAIIEKFGELKIKSNNAFETQALLQLKKEYCAELRCLECKIGNSILKN
ncbi:MAG: DUF2851 family protein [Flavobacteriaceae bacterium]